MEDITMAHRAYVQCDLTNLPKKLEHSNSWAEMLTYFVHKSELKQYQIAAQIHVSPSTLNQWMSGRRFPDSSVLIGLGQALNLSAPQTEIFMSAWAETYRIQGLKPLLELALQEQDVVLIENVVALLDGTLITT